MHPPGGHPGRSRRLCFSLAATLSDSFAAATLFVARALMRARPILDSTGARAPLESHLSLVATPLLCGVLIILAPDAAHSRVIATDSLSASIGRALAFGLPGRRHATKPVTKSSIGVRPSIAHATLVPMPPNSP